MKSKIEILCREFRRAIEKTDKNHLPITFINFPKGSCGDATILLGQYLFDNGLSQFEYVSGIRGEQSHVWLEKD